MGFGDLNRCADDESDFLSQSSINESDFQVFLKDDFMSLMQDINIDDLKNEETASTRNAVSSTQSS